MRKNKIIIYLICCIIGNSLYALKNTYPEKITKLRSPFVINKNTELILKKQQVEISLNIVESSIDLGKALGIKLSAYTSNAKGLFVDLPNKLPEQGAESARAAMRLGKFSKNILLDLELNALEKENKTKNIARPKLLTLDRQKASIEKGIEVPYASVNKDGVTNVSFKKAVLRLEVLPEIDSTNNCINLSLSINQDTPILYPNGAVPAINTNRIKTKVLVANGGTVMIGGIFKDLNQQILQQVPILGSIPVIGALFRNKLTVTQKNEIVVFVTPRIIF